MSLNLVKKLVRLPRRIAGKLRRELLKIHRDRSLNRKANPGFIAHAVTQGQLGLAEEIYSYWLKVSSAERIAQAGDFYMQAIHASYAAQTKNHTILKIASPSQWAEQYGKPVLTTANAEQIPVAAPPVLALGGFKAAETPAKQVTSLTPYVAEISNVIIDSQTAFLITEDGYALSDVAAHSLYGSDVSFIYEANVIARRGEYILLKQPYQAEKTIERGIYLCGYASEYFGHWVPEFLMKLKAYEQHSAYRDLPLIVDADMPQSHYDYLAAVSTNEIIRLPKGGAFRCTTLLVAPPPTFYPVHLNENHTIPQHEIGPLSPEGMRWLRDKVLSYSAAELSQKTSRFGKKLYLSRRNMKWRKATNDEEIAGYLTAIGFDVIDAETLTLEDQILMFRDAEVVVAPNGSSMLNMIFAPLSVKLLVLSQPEIYNWGGYYGPIHALGYDMLFVTGTDAVDTKHANYAVPISQVEAALAFNMDQHAAA